MSTKITNNIDVELETTELDVQCSEDTVTGNSHCVEMEHGDTVVTGLKKEYSIVGDALYASVNTGDAPLWLVTLIDAIVTNQIAIGMGDYDSLVQEVRDAVASIDIAKNTYVEQIWFDHNIDQIITARVEQINSTLGETYATVTSLQITEASLQQSLAASISQLESDYQGYTDGQITNIQSTLSNAIGTVQASITALRGAYEDESTGLAATAAAVESLTTYTGQLNDAIVARSAWAVDLDAFLGGNTGNEWGGYSSINDVINVTSDGLIQAAFQYDAELISASGDYYKTGFGLISTAGTGTELDPFTSEFWVQADKFKVVPAGSTPNPADPPLFTVDADTGQTVIGSQWVERNSITLTASFSDTPSSLQLTQELQLQTGEAVPRKGDTIIYTVESGANAGNYTAYYTGVGWSTNVALQVHGDAVIDGSVSLNKLIADASGYVASSNFVTGESGWAITGAGDAEFNTLSVRSSQIQGGLTGTESAHFDGIYAAGSAEPYQLLPVGNGGSAASGTNKFGTELGDHYGLDHPTTWTITNNYDIDATVVLSGVFNFGSGPTPAAGTGGHGQPADVQLKVYVKRSGQAKEAVAGGAMTMVYSTQMYTSGRFPIAAGESIDITVCVAGGFKPTSKDTYFYGGSLVSAMSTDITQTVVPPLVLPGQIEDDGLEIYRYMWSDTETGVYSETRGVNDVWQRVDTSTDNGDTWTLGTPVNVQGPQGDAGPVGEDGAQGPTGPRTSTGYLYYQLSSSTAPSGPTASSYNFTSGTFGSVTANWATTPPTFQAGNNNKYWYVQYTVRETSYGGGQNVTISSVNQGMGFSGLVTFSGTTLTNGSSNFNYTQIDGGWIKTGTIDADTVNVTNLNASNMTTGTLNANNVNITNLSADSITSGVLDTASIRVTDGSGNWIIRADLNSSYATLWRPSMYMAKGVNIADPSSPALKGTATVGGLGVYGLAGQSGGSNHGVRGQNTGAGSSGLVGSASGHAFYAESGSYGPFTGSHEGVAEKVIPFEAGDIIVDLFPLLTKGVSDAICLNERSALPRDKRAVGVYTHSLEITPETVSAAARVVEEVADWEGNLKEQVVNDPALIAFRDEYDLIVFNSVGEGLVNVTGENGDISIGDLIVTSSTPGKGMKQDDDIVRNYTVARSRQDVVFTDPTEVKQIACIYLCG